MLNDTTSAPRFAVPFQALTVLPTKGHSMLGAALIAAAAVVVYLPSLRGDFILDDDWLVTENQLVVAPDGLLRIWCTTEPIDYWPLTNTSFWIEWRLWGMNPTGYHVTNLLLHIASALLIWKILNVLSIPGAWLAALLFAVHPVNVESVAWIAQRKNTLSMLFFLLSILWYLKADRTVGRWYWLSLLAFTLAMLSKGSVAVLPLMLLLLAWWQRGSVTRQDLMRTAPFFVVAVVLAAVNVWFQTHGSEVTIRDATFLERLLGAGAVVWFYLYKALVPVNLLFIYPQWNIQTSDWRWWLPLAGAVGVTALLLGQRKTRLGRPLLLAWLFFCIALVPVMGFTDVGFMRVSLVADHYQYIAIIGVIALVAAGWNQLHDLSKGYAKRAVDLLAVIGVGALGFLAWEQNRLYGNPITLYQATLLENSDSWPIHYNLAIALSKSGRLEEAIYQYSETLRLKPDSSKARNNLAHVLVDAGRPLDAIHYIEECLRRDPDNAIYHNNLGNALAALGRVPEAIARYRQARSLNPGFVDAYINLGNSLRQTGQAREAIEQYEQAVSVKPDSALAHHGLARALAGAGQMPQAIDHLQQAVRLNPDFFDAQYDLANALGAAGRLPEALTSYRRVLQLKPDSATAHNNVGIILMSLGRIQEAMVHYELALQQRPDYLLALVNLAEAYALTGRFSEAADLAERALELARSSGQAAIVNELQRRLLKYRAGRSD